MLKIRILILLFIVNANLVFSQKESANWYFGDFAGLNFNSGVPVPLLDGKLITKEGCAAISDIRGNLLFYTDGITVWDRQHQAMPNGQGLMGHASSTESALIVPKPGSKSRFYIFTIDQPSYYLKENVPINGVNYSEVDLALNNGFGDVVPGIKNKHLVTYDTNDAFESEYKSTEKITAVTHSDGSSVWVITYFMGKFYSFLVDFNGVNANPVISTVPEKISPAFNDDGANVTAIGYLKVSPDGKKLAIAHSSTKAGSPRSGTKKSGKLLLYDFNSSNGIVSNELEILSGAYPYGVEFSPNSKLLYVTNNVFDQSDTFINADLFQYNLESSNIAGSRQTIKTSQNVAGALQLAIDGKVYRAGYKALGKGLSISVINSPNKLGTACDYSENTVGLGGRASELGLPPFVQSIFLYSFDYELTCLNDQTHFFITSEDLHDAVLWDFGDGQTSTLEEPYHTYASPGVYTVSLTLYLNGNEQDPLLKQIIISKPPDVLNTIYDLIQCDSYDSFPNDGISTFNLQDANSAISLNTTEAVQVYYYHSKDDADNDVFNTNALPNIYSNSVPNEILFAKVIAANTDCYNLAQVRLVAKQAFDIGDQEAAACDFDNDLVADFDLQMAASNISSSLNFPSDVSITFYEKENDAVLGINSLPNLYSSKSRMLYIKAESNNACYGSGYLYLKVKAFPQLNDQIISICSTDFPITISSGIDSINQTDYSYMWNTNQTTNEIQVNQPGVYSVRVYDDANCEKTVNVTVKQNETPSIKDLVIDGHSIQVVLANTPLSDYLFSVDNMNATYQSSNTFLDLKEGLHQLYVKDINSCETISREFYIFGFPKYFTPNNDGTNDTWNVYGLDPTQFSNKTLSLDIFDRYGKLIKSFNPLISKGWNGTYNGALLSPDDYWYYIKLPNGDEYRGHFALKI